MRAHGGNSSFADGRIFGVFHRFFYLTLVVCHRNKYPRRSHVHYSGNFAAAVIGQTNDTFQTAELRRHQNSRQVRIIKPAVFGIYDKKVHSAILQ